MERRIRFQSAPDCAPSLASSTHSKGRQDLSAELVLEAVEEGELARSAKAKRLARRSAPLLRQDVPLEALPFDHVLDKLGGPGACGRIASAVSSATEGENGDQLEAREVMKSAREPQRDKEG